MVKEVAMQAYGRSCVLCTHIRKQEYEKTDSLKDAREERGEWEKEDRERNGMDKRKKEDRERNG